MTYLSIGLFILDSSINTKAKNNIRIDRRKFSLPLTYLAGIDLEKGKNED